MGVVKLDVVSGRWMLVDNICWDGCLVSLNLIMGFGDVECGGEVSCGVGLLRLFWLVCYWYGVCDTFYILRMR